MNLTVLSLLLLAMSFAAFQLGRERSLAVAGGPGEARRLRARPRYHGYFVAIRSLVPALFIVLAWVLIEPRLLMSLALQDTVPDWRERAPGELDLLISSVRNLASQDFMSVASESSAAAAAERLLHYRRYSHLLLAVVALSAFVASGTLAWRRVTLTFGARQRVERSLGWLLIGASGVALLTTLGIVLSVIFEALRFFSDVPLADFLFGLDWSPQTAIRSDQVGSSGSFGAVPLFAGTLLITSIAMLIAVPIGLMTAIYLTEYSTRAVREFVKPLLEILAGIPTVVYGFFAAVTVAPFVSRLGESAGLAVSSESALAAGLVMGIMIIPLISSLSDDAISAVPTATRDGALALGSTRAEMMTQIIIPAALPGIAGGVLLAVSRAIGETMIVVMAAGFAANLTANPFESVTTVTVQIVTLLAGDQEFDSARTLAAFALGLVLFLVTLTLNVVGLRIVKHYREQYE